MKKYSSSPTPLFNSPDLLGIFSSPLVLDEQGLLRALEVIVFEGTPLDIEENLGQVVKVRCADYFFDGPLYTDRRFLSKERQQITRKMPSLKEMIQSLKEKISHSYIWGGNVCSGLDCMLHFYPPRRVLSDYEEKRWVFRGCDCSGLLYEVAKGLTPRNVSGLLDYGIEVKVYDKLVPLDLLIWPGHMVIVLDESHTIESKSEWGGVVILDLQTRLKLIEEERGSDFMIRRFHPEMLGGI